MRDGASTVLIVFTLERASVQHFALGTCVERHDGLYFVNGDTGEEARLTPEDVERNVYASADLARVLLDGAAYDVVRGMLRRAELCVCTIVPRGRPIPAGAQPQPSPFATLIVRNGGEITLTWESTTAPDDEYCDESISQPPEQRGCYSLLFPPSCSDEDVVAAVRRIGELRERSAFQWTFTHARTVRGTWVQIILQPSASPADIAAAAAALSAERSVVELRYDERCAPPETWST